MKSNSFTIVKLILIILLIGCSSTNNSNLTNETKGLNNVKALFPYSIIYKQDNNPYFYFIEDSSGLKFIEMTGNGNINTIGVLIKIK